MCRVAPGLVVMHRSIAGYNPCIVRGLFDKFVELFNKSVNFKYFFLKFSHVIYLPNVNTIFKFQSSYTLSSLNIGYHSNLCVARCRAPFFTEIIIHFLIKRNPRRIANSTQTKQTI